MLIIKEIDFTQRKVIGLETDGELIEVNLNKSLLKLVFSKDNIIVKKEIKKVKVKEDSKEEISKKKNKKNMMMYTFT